MSSPFDDRYIQYGQPTSGTPISSIHMVGNEEQLFQSGLDTSARYGFDSVNGAENLFLFANKHAANCQGEIRNNSISHFDHIPFSNKNTAFTINSNSTKNMYQEHGEGEKQDIIIVIKNQEGVTEHVAVPRSAADIISALHKEALDLRLELDRLQSSRQTTMPQTKNNVGGKLSPLVSDASEATNDMAESDEESTVAPVAKEPKKATVESSPRKRKGSPVDNQGENKGRWSEEEHRLFLQGMKLHGRRWTKVTEIVKTRTDVQIRTHAQKYFKKLFKANGVNGDDLDEEEFNRLLDADLKSIVTTNKRKKSRHGNETKTQNASTGSAGSFIAPRIASAIQGRGATVHGDTPVLLSPVLSHCHQGPSLPSPVTVATKPIIPMMPGNNSMGGTYWGTYANDRVGNLGPSVVSSTSTPTMSREIPSSTTMADLVTSYASKSAFRWSNNDTVAQPDRNADGIDAETLDLLLHD